MSVLGLAEADEDAVRMSVIVSLASLGGVCEPPSPEQPGTALMTTGWRPGFPPSRPRKHHHHRSGRPPSTYLAALLLGTVVLCSAAPRLWRGMSQEAPASRSTSRSASRGNRVLDVESAVALVSQGTLHFDAVVVLGGGPPVSERRPLQFVEIRCDAAKRIFEVSELAPKVLCVSAGTAHSRQLMRDDGLPVWESTAAAAYLLDAGLPDRAVVVETASYDTIGNAYFTRTSHTDVAGWRRLCVVTSDFHVARTKAIFDWIFADADYDITYVETPPLGLSPDAVAARRDREAKSIANVNRLAVAYPTLRDVHTYLTTQHDLYAAHRLAAHDIGPIDALSMASYGGAPQQQAISDD